MMMLSETMTEFKLLTVEDSEIFRRYNEEMRISDMGFTQLYAWQEEFRNRYRIVNDYLCTFYRKTSGMGSFYVPLGVYERDKYYKTLLELEQISDHYKMPFCFDFVPENWLERFMGLPDFKAEATFQEDFSDYIFKAEEFLCLTGKVNERKRYQVNYFKNHFTYDYQSLTMENRQDAFWVMDHWCSSRDCKDCFWGCEKRAVTRILEHWDAFNCKGAIIYVEGVPAAFMIGEQISKDMVVSHFQKADKQMKGLYAFLSHEFYIREYPDITYINLQEDMGIKAVRESKLFYHPCHMLRKYTVSLTRR
ncbi:MAG: DUF2156 domain-containing protein [Lachnospiraceae bacterium]